uniref:D-alanyl-D-alanine carboxypeptidase/D-alanyl-D-alanine-endopeptidase n=1 Tax=uncultured Psychrobacter sp. TaxID=259303 RepID=UPI002621B6EE|nr:D-alanyl-D-alanine carboxypeptidase [uncultured Psychrobacter sp.]
MTLLYRFSNLLTIFCATDSASRHRHVQRSKLLTGIMLSVMPLTSQAALPASIEAALNKAELSPVTISILITPLGDTTKSRLPAIIEVIDSDTNDNSNNDSEVSAERNSADSTTVSVDKVAASASDAPVNDPADDNVSVNSSKAANVTIAVDKQAIEQQNRQLQAYTDDPYTYQSLENPPVLTIDESRSVRHSESKDTGKRQLTPLISHNIDTPRTPASTMKLIPSFVALDTLGADFVWFTRVYYTGLILGDRLQGNLIIQGSGDPKMTHARLEQLLYQVQKTGIRHIDGDIIVDSSIFNNVSKDPAAFDNAPLRPYNASPDGFLVNFNSLAITTYPMANGQAKLTYTPQLANYQLPSHIGTRSARCSQARNSLALRWQQDKLALNAKLPESCGEHVFYVNHPDAKDFAARVIASKWQALGNTLNGEVLSQEKPYAAYHSTNGLSSLPLSPLPLVSYPSYNLTRQIYDINHFSNNVMTEQVALSIGSYYNAKRPDIIDTNNSAANSSAVKGQTITDVNNTKPNATSLYQFGQATTTDYPQALARIDDWWQTNLTTTPPYLTNGSGLCRDCTLTAANLNELLSFAYRHPSFDAYVNSLGVAGVSGTIMHHSERLPESKAIGRAWIKTGTLSNVTAMAGYVKGQSGQDYAVVGIINTDSALNPYLARPVLDAMLDWTAEK